MELILLFIIISLIVTGISGILTLGIAIILGFFSIFYYMGIFIFNIFKLPFVIMFLPFRLLFKKN